MGQNHETGRWPLTGFKDGYMDKPVPVPCGRCMGCKLERSRQWAIRCVHENQMHKESCFVTLTYRNENLKFNFVRPTLYPRDLQLFFKKLRKKYNGKPIRYFACGEYGERYYRPHYHAIIFGHDFEDKKYHNTENDNKTYTSSLLDDVWSHGNCLIGDVTFQSAAYVARYIMDKKLGREVTYYKDHDIEPEFVRMSRRPGIGSTWIDKYEMDVFPQDKIILNGGVPSTVPRYYTERQILKNPEQMKKLLELRRIAALKHSLENTSQRLAVREEVKMSQITSILNRNTFTPL